MAKPSIFLIVFENFCGLLLFCLEFMRNSNDNCMNVPKKFRHYLFLQNDSWRILMASRLPEKYQNFLSVKADGRKIIFKFSSEIQLASPIDTHLEHRKSLHRTQWGYNIYKRILQFSIIQVFRKMYFSFFLQSTVWILHKY